MRERGQTETLGYVLVFSVVVLSVALVTISGQAGLVDLRDNQRAANVEAGFEVLADNVDQVVLEGAPGRSTELSLSGERLSLGSRVNVTVTATDGGTTVFSNTTSLRPVVYRADDGTTLTYAAGGVVVQGPDGGAAMVRSPRFVLSSDRTVVAFANTTLDRSQLRAEAAAVDRESRVLVRADRGPRRVLGTADGTVDLTVTVESPRATAWEAYLDAEVNPGSDDCSVSGDTATCTFRTDSATLVVTPVAVSFE